MRDSKKKTELKRLLKIFEPYISKNRNFDFLFSERYGCIRLCSPAMDGDVEVEPIHSPKELVGRLVYEMIQDYCFQTTPSLKRITSEDIEKIRRKNKRYLDCIPEYDKVVKKEFSDFNRNSWGPWD